MSFKHIAVYILLDYMPYEVHTSDEIKEGLYACSYHHNRMKKQMQRTRSYLHTLIKRLRSTWRFD